MTRLIRIQNTNKFFKVEMPHDLMQDIHERVNAPFYSENMSGKVGVWKSIGGIANFKIIDIFN